MAQTTANFGFNIAEGTDIVNLLTQCYPNFTSLDSILQGIKETGVTVATDTKVGTVHQLVRTDSDCNMFRFIATGNYVSGDTFTVDGNAVTATAMDGTSLPGGAFVINQSVVGILNGLVLTIVGVTGVSSVNASDVTYDNTSSGLAATDVQNAIDEVAGDIPANAAALSYDNTGSGLSATNVQDAIDEVVSSSGGHSYTATEKAVGTWIDGTTIYEKSYGATGVSLTGTTVIDAALTNSYVSKIVEFTGATEYSGSAWSLFDKFGGNEIRPIISSTGLSIQIGSETCTAYSLTVRYTK